MVEEYHKALKTGVEIETLQFTTRGGLDVTIGVLSVVAVSLLDLRELARRSAPRVRPGGSACPAVVGGRTLVVRARVRTDWTVYEFVMALARLGGHQNRKHDHPPGWIVLWPVAQLQTMLQGAAAVARE